MQGVSNNEFGDLKSSLDMGFTSVVQMLNIINDDNEKTRKVVGSILDRLDNLADNIGQTFNTGIGKLGLGSFTNYSKLSYKVQLDIFRTIKNLSQLQKKVFDKLMNTSIDFGKINKQNPEEVLQTQGRQGAVFGGKVINTKAHYEFNLAKGDSKTMDSFTKALKEVNKFMTFSENKFQSISKFFTDISSQLQIITKYLKPAAFGFAMLSASLLMLQYVSFINVLKLATILPILGIGMAMFIGAMVSATRKIGGGITGMFKFWRIMKALPDIFLNLGKGILLLSVGLVLFNLVGYDSILKLITTMISLGIAFKLMAGGDDSMTGTAKLFIVIGIILATTHALIQTKAIPWDSVLKLPTFIAGLGLALHIGGFDKFSKIRIMNMLSISLLLLTLSLITFNHISWENVIKYNVFISLLGLSLRVIKKDMPLLGVMALGFVAMTVALLDFQELNWMTILQIVGVIGLLGVVVNKFVLGRFNGRLGGVSESLSGGGFRGGGMIGFAIGLLLLTFAIQRFSQISWNAVKKAILMIGALGLTFKLFFREKQEGMFGRGSRIQVPSMIGFALGLGLLVLALDAVSEIEWKSVFQLVTLMFAIGLIFKFLMPQKSKSTGLLGFALGMGLLILALDAMTEIAWESVYKLVGFMVGIGIAMFLIGKGAGFFGMIGVALSVGIIALVLYEAGKHFTNKTYIATNALLLTIVALGVITFFLGKFWSQLGPGLLVLAGLGLATGLMVNALSQMKNVSDDWQDYVNFVIGVTVISIVVGILGALVLTGIGALVAGAGIITLLGIAFATYIMANALAEIGAYKYNPLAFVQFGYGMKAIINAYIDLDPIATLASIVTALATIPILLTSLIAIGILKLIDYTFSGNTTLATSVYVFSKSLGLLITSFNNSIGLITAGEAAIKGKKILPVLGIMYLAALLLTKISNTEWDPKKLGYFNEMFNQFIENTVNTINEHRDSIIKAQPGLKSITQLINVASSLANVVKNISSLRFVEMGVVNGKVVVTGIRQLGPQDFENVGKSIGSLIMALINPINALGMDTDTWRIGSDTIQNPFKNNTFLNGIDNIKKISEAFKPLVDTTKTYADLKISQDYGAMNRWIYSVKEMANSYGYVFAKFASIKKNNLLNDALKTISKIEDFNELFEDLEFDQFEGFDRIFKNFIDRLSDANKWKQIHKNINTLTANLQKTVKAINSIDLEKAAALEVNIKQLTDKNNINHIKEVVEQFVNLFGIIGENQYQQAMLMNGASNNFMNGTNSFNNTAQSLSEQVNNVKNKEGNETYQKLKSGETVLSLSNFNSEEQKIIKEGGYDSNNDGQLDRGDIGITSAFGDKLDKLIAILQAQQSTWRK